MTNPSEEKTVDAPKVEKPAKAEKKVNPEAMSVAEQLMRELNLDDFLTSDSSERTSESSEMSGELSEFDEMMFEDTTKSLD